jgi:HPt (histidine-containing phosphotransfer) domain-containing protein
MRDTLEITQRPMMDCVPPLESELANDPELAELVDFFLDHLTECQRELATAAAACDWAELRLQAHRLKGAAGGYGYPAIGAAAAKLEQAARTAAADIDAIGAALDETLCLCRRATAGQTGLVARTVQQ